MYLYFFRYWFIIRYWFLFGTESVSHWPGGGPRAAWVSLITSGSVTNLVPSSVLSWIGICWLELLVLSDRSWLTGLERLVWSDWSVPVDIDFTSLDPTDSVTSLSPSSVSSWAEACWSIGIWSKAMIFSFFTEWWKPCLWTLSCLCRHWVEWCLLGLCGPPPVSSQHVYSNHDWTIFCVMWHLFSGWSK